MDATRTVQAVAQADAWFVVPEPNMCSNGLTGPQVNRVPADPHAAASGGAAAREPRPPMCAPARARTGPTQARGARMRSRSSCVARPRRTATIRKTALIGYRIGSEIAVTAIQSDRPRLI
jgi:hypothetical protein